jgi:hypothetical protein
MYTCEVCRTVSEPRQPAYKIPVETRIKRYQLERRAAARRRPWPRRRRDPDADEIAFVFGTEIAREATVCAACHARHEERQRAVPPRVIVDRR